MLKLALFVGVSAGLIYLSRASLRAPRSHGFYRFFLWELLLVLVLLNLDDWFRDPFCARQLVSWGLFLPSAYLVAHGAWVLHRYGKSSRSRAGPVPLMGIERTTVIVTDGAYRYIRHPIYGSALYGAWGIFLKDPSLAGVSLTLLVTILLVIIAKVEEAECIEFFGSAYQEYMRHTKMFIPFVF